MNQYQFARWREEVNLTQRQIAILFEVHENTVSRWVNGTAVIPAVVDYACAALLAGLPKQSVADAGGVL